ncbi:MAG: hypothetical protein FWE27_06530 [Defluviitaleaceae bacterium]|nr:hypothetical protein [Defluviitaleaceae bacterium]
MSFLPGTYMAAERKRFVIFHACTLLICVLINFILAITLTIELYKNLAALFILISFVLWNGIGSLRFFYEAYKETDRNKYLNKKLFSAIMIVFFPLYYLYILVIFISWNKVT